MSAETVEQAKARYRRAAHAMQSGVAAALAHDSSSATPKHLRVGVNSAMVENAALVKLLMDKGLITESEWFASLADAMEREVRLYQSELSARYGRDIRLG